VTEKGYREYIEKAWEGQLATTIPQKCKQIGRRASNGVLLMELDLPTRTAAIPLDPRWRLCGRGRSLQANQ
jgi:hypothetical protein